MNAEIKEILKKMKKLNKSNDQEVPHRIADNLLLETVRLLGHGNETIVEILYAWVEIEKRYA